MIEITAVDGSKVAVNDQQIFDAYKALRSIELGNDLIDFLYDWDDYRAKLIDTNDKKLMARLGAELYECIDPSDGIGFGEYKNVIDSYLDQHPELTANQKNCGKSKSRKSPDKSYDGPER